MPFFPRETPQNATKQLPWNKWLVHRNSAYQMDIRENPDIPRSKNGSARKLPLQNEIIIIIIIIIIINIIIKVSNVFSFYLTIIISFKYFQIAINTTKLL
jgi:hypothetical protein